jgi:hypothetical protein
MAASPRKRARTICSCSSLALAVNPRRNNARSRPMINAPMDPARIVSLVSTITVPPLLRTSRRSFLFGV